MSLTSQRLDAMAAAILPLLPMPAARLPYDQQSPGAKAQLRRIAETAYAEAIKDDDQ